MCCSKLYYRQQRSCEGYVFTPVFHSVHGGGVCLSACWNTTPPEQTPPRPGTPRSRHPPPGSRHPLPRLGTSSGLGTHPPPGSRQTATVADGTHHTGLHSCFKFILLFFKTEYTMLGGGYFACEKMNTFS